MRNIKQLVAVLVIAAGIIALNSCDVTKVTDVVLQITIDFDPKFTNKAVPDSSLDVVDLNDYPEYEENSDKIEDAEILHFNYRIDRIRTRNNMPLDSIIFKSVNFYLIPTTSAGDRIPGQRYKLGEFTNLQVSEYFRTAKQIVEVSSEVGQLISEQIKKTPHFIFVTEYSELVGEKADKNFDFIDAHVDMVIRVRASQ